MAVHHAKEALLKIGANTILEAQSARLTESSQVEVVTPLGQSAPSRAVGGEDWALVMQFNWDPDDATGQELLTKGAAVTPIAQFEGDASGDRSGTGPGIVESVEVGVDAGGFTKRDVTIVANGAWAWSNLA